MGNDKVTSGRRAKKLSQVSGKFKILIIIGIVAIGSILGITGFLVYNYVTAQAQAPGADPATTTFVGFDYVSGEEISSHAHIKILGLKDTVENPDSDDIRTLTNFEELEAVDDIEDISVDLSTVPYYYIVINPAGDQYWATTYQLEYGMKNVADKEISLYHQASDVDGTILDTSTMDEWDLTSNITHALLIINIPQESALELHKGDGWETSTTEYTDLETVDQLFFQNQANYRCEFPTYSPTLDLDKDGQDELEVVTNVFAIEFTFNATVSLVDGATTQINITINDKSPIDLAYSATKIFMLFHRVIDFEDGAYSVAFDVAMSTHIECSSVKTVRVPVPYETSSLGTPVVLSTFPLT